MSRRHFVFQVGLLIVLGLLYCAQGQAQTASCDPNAPVKVQGPTTTIGPVSFLDGCKFRFLGHALQLANLSCTSLPDTATAVSASTVQAILNATTLPATP